MMRSIILGQNRTVNMNKSNNLRRDNFLLSHKSIIQISPITTNILRLSQLNLFSTNIKVSNMLASLLFIMPMFRNLRLKPTHIIRNQTNLTKYLQLWTLNKKMIFSSIQANNLEIMDLKPSSKYELQNKPIKNLILFLKIKINRKSVRRIQKFLNTNKNTNKQILK